MQATSCGVKDKCLKLYQVHITAIYIIISIVLNPTGGGLHNSLSSFNS